MQKRTWRAATPEKLRESRRKSNLKYYEKNRESLQVKYRAKRVADPDGVRKKDRARIQAWRAANPEKVRSWRTANREKELARGREHYAANRENILAKRRAWFAANPEKRRAQRAGQRARKRGQSGFVSPDIERRLLEQQRNRCAAPWCRKKLAGRKAWHLDHIIPLARGGLHDDENLQILCAPCNVRKNAKHPDDWLIEHGELPLTGVSG